jgi:hypothetical protein
MSHHPPAIFIADSRGLDFLNSVATPVDTPVDWISDGEGLLDWLGQANYVPPDVLKEIRARAKPDELDQVAEQARELREWCRGFVRKHMGKSLSQPPVLPLRLAPPDAWPNSFSESSSFSLSLGFPIS